MSYSKRKYSAFNYNVQNIAVASTKNLHMLRKTIKEILKSVHIDYVKNDCFLVELPKKKLN